MRRPKNYHYLFGRDFRLRVSATRRRISCEHRKIRTTKTGKTHPAPAPEALAFCYTLVP